MSAFASGPITSFSCTIRSNVDSDSLQSHISFSSFRSPPVSVRSLLLFSPDLWIAQQSQQLVPNTLQPVVPSPASHLQLFSRVRNALYPMVLSILLVTLLLLFHSESYTPFLFQWILIGLFFCFQIGVSDAATASYQFEIWFYFVAAILLPLSLFLASTAGSALQSPLRWALSLLILTTFPITVFLGLLSSCYFSWMSRVPRLPSPRDRREPAPNPQTPLRRRPAADALPPPALLLPHPARLPSPHHAGAPLPPLPRPRPSPPLHRVGASLPLPPDVLFAS